MDRAEGESQQRQVEAKADVPGLRRKGLSVPFVPGQPLNEACLKTLIENINDVIFALDGNGRFTYISPTITAFAGYAPEEVTGISFMRFVHPEDLPTLQEAFLRTLSGELYPSEFRILTKDGRSLHVRSSSRPLMIDGQAVGLTGVVTDISARISAENALREAQIELEQRIELRTNELMHSNLNLKEEILERRRMEQIHAALFKISEATHAASGLPTLFRQIHETLGDLLPVRNFYVALYDVNTEELTFPYFVDELDPAPPSRKLGQGLTDYVIRTREALLLTPERLVELVQEGKVRVRGTPPLDWLGVPLISQKGIVGVLSVESYTGDIRYTERDKFLLQFVSNQVATAIERTRSEQALRESELRFKRVAETTGEWIWEVDVEGCFIYSNPVVETMLGFAPEDLIGKRYFYDLFVPEERNILMSAAFELFAKNAPFKGFVNPCLHQNGDRIILETRSAPISDEHGRISGYCGSSTDITDRFRAEGERRSLERQIQQAQKLESLGLLAGGIAHDFNNLLNAILGHLELASLDTAKTSATQKYLQGSIKACHAAADLCRQMLAFSGRGRFLLKAVNLNEVVAEMAQMLEVSTSKKASLVFKLAAELPVIEADTSQIQQIVMNLVVNASEALDSARGPITLSTGVIHGDQELLTSRWSSEELPDGDYVFLEVSDTGIGMDAETLSKIFDPFFTTKFTGRGLGLAAVLGIVKGHKGAIHVDSEPGVGTTFTVLFPIHGPAGSLKPQMVPSEASWRGSGTALLVDDEAVLREVGKEFLERLGFKTITADDGTEAISLFKAHRDEITCILLDLTMPVMDGIETFKELRRLECQAPVLMISGYSERDVSSRLSGQGLAGFLQKPYSWTTLSAKLAEVLG